ncbi:MAG TPA: hypothetical protein VEA41_22350 [Salinarimonas sp.]|nr:hypothetical protein [Salinarimonas sp.]
MPRVIKRALPVNGPTAPERKWTRILKRWRKSGQEGRTFCRHRGLRESAFRFWLREIPERARRREAQKKPVRLLPARIVSAAAPTGRPLEVLVGSGRAIRVGPDFDPALLLQVVRALEVAP